MGPSINTLQCNLFVIYDFYYSGVTPHVSAYPTPFFSMLRLQRSNQSTTSIETRCSLQDLPVPYEKGCQFVFVENYVEYLEEVSDSSAEEDEESRLLSLEDICLSCRESPSDFITQCRHTYCYQCRGNLKRNHYIFDRCSGVSSGMSFMPRGCQRFGTYEFS